MDILSSVSEVPVHLAEIREKKKEERYLKIL